MSDDNTFSSGFEAGQHLGDLLRQGTPNPVLTAIAIGAIKGLQEGLKDAREILQVQLDHDLSEAQLEREHRAKQADYSRRMEDYTRSDHGGREDA